MSHVLGIDGGATKTVCILTGVNGHVVGRGEAGPANIHKVSIETAYQSILTAVSSAAASLGIVEVEAICIGSAGVDRPGDVQIIAEFIHRLKCEKSIAIKWSIKHSTTITCNDGLIALTGGIGKPEGVVAITGTGSFIFGRNQHGQTGRVGGWGHILGDEGSAYDIAIRGIKAVLASHDGRSGATQLTERFLEQLQIRHVQDIVEVIYQRELTVSEIASLAPIVDDAAFEGDLIAFQIIDRAAIELADAALVVIDKLFSRDETIEVVTAGSVWSGKSGIRQRFEKMILERAPVANVIPPRHEPAYGACLLAIDSIGKHDNC